jgi:hypothetical protein
MGSALLKPFLGFLRSSNGTVYAKSLLTVPESEAQTCPKRKHCTCPSMAPRLVSQILSRRSRHQDHSSVLKAYPEMPCWVPFSRGCSYFAVTALGLAVHREQLQLWLGWEGQFPASSMLHDLSKQGLQVWLWAQFCWASLF